MMGARLIDMRGLDVRLGDRKVLNAVATQFSEGELVAVIGPNGAGKTTFLRALAGLVPSSGELRFGDRDWRSLNATTRARIIAYLEQRGAIAWPLPVWDIVGLGRLPFVSGLEADARAVESALDLCDLQTFAERPATELSGGERARVLLARTLASDAKMLLLDEPVASLDPAWQLGVMDILQAQARAGRCVVAVLHDLSLALRYADRVLLFAAGALHADAAPEALLAGGALERAFGVRIEQVATKGGLVIGASLPPRI